MTALEIVRDIHTVWLTDLNDIVTQLGAPYVVFPLAAIATVVLIIRRHLAEAAVLFFSMLLIILGVDLLKEIVDRPRPPDRLDNPAGSSYPSGHAAYSIFYVWAGAMIARHTSARQLSARLTVQGTLIAIGILIAAAVGLSRVYLRVHYLSDVSGGWGLGVTMFALCGIVAIVATHLRRPTVRQNGAAPAAAPGPADP